MSGELCCGIDFGTTNCSITLHRTNSNEKPRQVIIQDGSIRRNYLRNLVLWQGAESPHLGNEAEGILNILDPSLSREEPGGALLLEAYKPLLNLLHLRYLTQEDIIHVIPYDPYLQETIIRISRRLVNVHPERPFLQRLQEGCQGILRTLLNNAAKALDRENEELTQVSKFCLGIPTVFGSLAKRRLVCALRGALAELGCDYGFREILQRVVLIPEPVAAVYAMIDRLEEFDIERPNVLVFDCGGGSLDVSLLRFDRSFGEGPTREIASDGLGRAGRHIDRLILDGIKQCIESSNELRREQKAAALEALERRYDLALGYCERIKIDLCCDPGVRKGHFLVQGLDFSWADMAAFSRPYLDEISELLRRVTSETQPDVVLMVGGSSANPLIREVVTKTFPEAHARGRIIAPPTMDPTKGLVSASDSPDVQRFQTGFFAIGRGLPLAYEYRMSGSGLDTLSGSDLILWRANESEPDTDDLRQTLVYRDTTQAEATRNYLECGAQFGTLLLRPDYDFENGNFAATVTLHERILGGHERFVLNWINLEVDSEFDLSRFDLAVYAAPAEHGVLPNIKVVARHASGCTPVGELVWTSCSEEELSDFFDELSQVDRQKTHRQSLYKEWGVPCPPKRLHEYCLMPPINFPVRHGGIRSWTPVPRPLNKGVIIECRERRSGRYWTRIPGDRGDVFLVKQLRPVSGDREKIGVTSGSDWELSKYRVEAVSWPCDRKHKPSACDCPGDVYEFRNTDLRIIDD